VHTQLEKENNSYGFTVRGGYNEDKLKSRPLIVTNIRAGGAADREGTLKIGDRIVAINGISLVNATLQDAYYIIKQCKGLTLFLVEYDSAVVDSIKNSSGPLLIEIEKSAGSSIGIKLMLAKHSPPGQVSGPQRTQILVESVKQASIADRCGAIYVGDQILSIDDISFEHVTLAEANQILKNCVGEFTRVEILPLSQMNGKHHHQQSQSQNSQKSIVFFFLLNFYKIADHDYKPQLHILLFSQFTNLKLFPFYGT
jgi:C-terminal processing protease CtpA/Prc